MPPDSLPTNSSIELREGLPVQIAVKGRGIAFCREKDGIEVEMEFPDYSGWSGTRIGTQYVTIPFDVWDAIVQHVQEANDVAS